MSAPTSIPAVIVGADLADTEPMRVVHANGPTGPFPVLVVDSRGRPWTTGSLALLGHKIGYDAMAKFLAEHGLKPYAYDEAFLRMEDVVRHVMAGDHVEIGVQSARRGFIDAAVDYWRDVATVAGRNTEDPDATRFQLENEVVNWTAVPDLPVLLVDDGVRVGLEIGVEDRRQSQRPPLRAVGTARPTQPKHVRHDTGRQRSAS